MKSIWVNNFLKIRFNDVFLEQILSILDSINRGVNSKASFENVSVVSFERFQKLFFECRVKFITWNEKRVQLVVGNTDLVFESSENGTN